jgi:hypothetical protein
MDVKKIVVHGAIAAVLAGGALGTGVVPANAEPDADDWGRGEWVDKDWRDNDWQWRNNEWRDHDWEWKRWDDHRWHKWWLVHKWRNDDRPPWGWGPPPPVHWRGHPPPWIDYWGYRVQPVWDPGFAAFGFWLFGVFIPVVII